MVKVKEARYHLPDGGIDIDNWLYTISDKYTERQLKLIKSACHFAQYTGGNHLTISGHSCLSHGLMMAEILADLNADEKSIAAAILYNNVEFADLNLEDITEQLNQDIASLIEGTHQMEAVHNLPIYLHSHNQNRSQIDNIRKMLLAMAEDVRVVLIKLAERLTLLRKASNLAPKIKELLAHEMGEIYAPLASRLGIGHIKWELEDLSFRFRDPTAYKDLAKQLDSKRLDRENYVQDVQQTLRVELHQAGITDMDISGRAKHIYSIYKKMVRKKVDYAQIYDAIAVRILVDTIEDCYKCLGVVHGLWEHIPEEFDDYITNPKPNGYRSLHTAVVGPSGKNVEVQIRTHEMHQESELGVAAHWKYKEGAANQHDYEEKINWLRQVLDWQNYLVEQGKPIEQAATKKVFGDRVYVFTPNNEIVDLPVGATPLDFAYNIHTEVGHRCKGAKINGHIVPLTHKLATGDKLEVITAKHPRPSRDWLNANAGYLFTSRAKAKVLHWFKQQDYDEHLQQGQQVLEQELSRLNIPKADLKPIAEKYNYKSVNDLLAGVGRGDIRIHSLVNQIQQSLGLHEEQQKTTIIATPTKPKKSSANDIVVDGLDNVLITLAKCCKPVPGDNIVGYITKLRGVTIHTTGCSNLINTNPDKLISVSWANEPSNAYPVDLLITANERQALLKDITTLLNNKKIKLLQLSTHTSNNYEITTVNITIEISELDQLNQLIAQMGQITNVIDIKRPMFKE